MKFVQMARRVGAAALAAALLATAVGCGSKTAGSTPQGAAAPAKTAEDDPSAATSTGNTATSPMGRWVEEKVALDENITPYGAPQPMDDGSLVLYGEDGKTIYRYISQDDGASWLQTPTNWADLAGDIPPLMATAPDGAVLFNTYEQGGMRTYLKEAGSDTPTELTLPEGLDSINQMTILDPDTVLISGSTKSSERPANGMEAEGDAGTDAEGNPVYYSPVCAVYDLHLQNKRLDLTNPLGGSVSFYNSPVSIDFVSGPAADRSAAGWQFYQITYTESGAALQTVDETGTAQTVFENLPSARDAAFGAAADKDGSYYYFSPDGIYRVAKGGSLAELVFEATTFQMGVSGVLCRGLSHSENGSFFALLANMGTNEATLYRYYYDETLPAAPADGLVVWSLEDNQTVRAAIVQLAAEHPEIGVEYQAALASGVTKTDAISTLNAELLAGSGPDVLILDGLDYKAYQQKGLLADYSASVDTAALLPNIVAPFLGSDGSVTVLPARFSVPMVYSDNGETAQLNSLAALQAAILACPPRPAMDSEDHAYYENRAPGQRYGMSFLTAADLLDFTLQSAAPAIWDGSSLNTDAVREVLGFVQGVANYYGMKDYKKEPQINGVSGGGEGSDAVTQWDGGYEYGLTGGAAYGRGVLQTPAFLGDIRRTQGDAGTVAVVQPGPTAGAYLPGTLAAVNASSQKQEQAGAFLSALFSETVQELYQEDGCPVRQTALAASIARNQSAITKGGYTGDVQALFATLQTPVLPLDEEIHAALLQAANALVDGTKTLDDAVTEVQNALTLYLSEKQ
ncbi:MAG: hypothetical protein PHO10_11050 [Gemmiger sp.]|nr:hypothetical protein [Gemmiger sp.]